MQIKPFLSFQLLYCWSALAFLCRRSWGQLSLTNRDPSAKISRRDKRPKMVVLLPSLLFVLVSTSLFFFNTSPFKVTGCSVVFSSQNILYILYTHSYWQRAWITTILFTTFISTGVTSEWSIVNWQCTTGNIIRVWLWSWFPLDIQTSPVMKSSSQFVIFVSAVMVTVWGQVVHHWSLINSITGSATGLTNLFCHNKAD